ncbi:hypothetical protein ACFWG7_24110 [Streptomyces koyangensis]|uniref:hypothetical protein n=1 Tax=Streptomyces TaxID=1883 RepID=UPI00339472D5
MCDALRATEAKGNKGGRSPAVPAGKTDDVRTAYLAGQSIASLAREQPLIPAAVHPLGIPPLINHRKTENPGDHLTPGSSVFEIDLEDNRLRLAEDGDGPVPITGGTDAVTTAFATVLLSGEAIDLAPALACAALAPVRVRA